MSHPTAYIIAGMHRSGTSLLASLFGSAGVDLGTLISADSHNPFGYFEDSDVLSLHRRMIHSALPDEDTGHRDWGWIESERFSRERLNEYRDEARSFVESRRAAGRVWGFKEPRTTLFLDFWRELVPEAQFVFIYRHPWDVAESMQRLGADVFLKNPEYALKIWSSYNRLLLDFHSRLPERTLLISANRMVQDPQAFIAAVHRKFGLNMEAKRVETILRDDHFRTREASDPLPRLHAVASPGIIEQLEALDAASDLPRVDTTEWRSLEWKRIKANPESDPVITIVVPCRNHGEFLLDALASVERCAPEGTELLIVDDGSTQSRTLEVLQALRRVGCRIIIGGGRGLSSARNLAIRESRGRYILPLDADNRLLPGFLEMAIAILDAEPDVGVVHGDWVEFGGRNGRRETHDAVLTELLMENQIDACAVIRREAIERVGGYCEEFSMWEDWDLWISFCEHGIRFVRLMPETLRATFEYRVRPDSMVRQVENQEILIHAIRKMVHRHAHSYLSRREAIVYRAANVYTAMPLTIRAVLRESAAIAFEHAPA